jgi:polyisoprenoid-binding protein YceI
MRILDWKSLGISAGALAGLAVFLSASAAPPKVHVEHATPAASSELSLVLDPAQSKVHWTVDSTLHTVHGTFAFKSGTLRLDQDTGKAAGEIIVLATSGDSDNSSRDEKMHKVVLESAKFPDVVFRPTQLEGKLATSGANDVKLHGVFVLHGTEHELIVPVHTEMSKGTWKGETKFDVPYIKWGLKDPSNWLLKVKPAVQVNLDLAGTWKTGE